MATQLLLPTKRGSSISSGAAAASRNSNKGSLLTVIWFSLIATIWVSFTLRWTQLDSTSSFVSDDGDDKAKCQQEYDRVNENRHKLTLDDYDRSRALVGNRRRLSNVARKLRSLLQRNEKHNHHHHQALNVVVCGGSISIGHGVEPASLRYSDRLQHWLNTKYPIIKTSGGGVVPGDQKQQQQQQQHRVYNKGAHGADMCAMAKRIHLLINNLPPKPDLFILEFAVNDYQGQDQTIHIDHKTDVFFEGFERLALCAEIVVYKLLSEYPEAAVMFLEFQTAIANRKTAAVLHMGVAKHYQVPVISYAETMFPDFYQLQHALKAYNYSTATLPKSNKSSNNNPDGNFSADPVLPYPHGCVPCHDQQIIPLFREFGCKSLCIFAHRSGEIDEEEYCTTVLPPGREPCYVSFLAHDAVHPSAVGHQIASDLIAHAISSTARDMCEGRKYTDHALPRVGWMVTDPTTLQQHSEYVLVKDTMQFFAEQHPLKASKHSPGFSLVKDAHDRTGWIAANPKGGEMVEFLVDLPTSPCYAIFVSVLKSYEKVGTFNITVTDLVTQRETTSFFDALWKPRISIPSDVQVTPDTTNPAATGCTGKCKVSIKTHPQIPDRKGNQVKVVTLSVRKCISKK